MRNGRALAGGELTPDLAGLRLRDNGRHNQSRYAIYPRLVTALAASEGCLNAGTPVLRRIELLGGRCACGDAGARQDYRCRLHRWRARRIEAYLAVAVGILVIVLGLWMLWAQRDLVALAMGEAGEPGDGTSRADARARDHIHHHAHDHLRGHEHGEPVVWHSHGFGKVHAHRLDVVAENRPKLPVLLALGIAGGLLPDPAALALLLGALSSGKVLLGLVTVVVFSLGFAATLVVVGIVAAKVGEKVLDWLASIWMIRLQIATSLLIVGMGVVLTVRTVSELAALPAG
jgi:nickel/cobalt exporter